MKLLFAVVLALACSAKADDVVSGTVRFVSFSPDEKGVPWGISVQLKGDEKKYQIDLAEITIDGKKATPTEFIKWAISAGSPIKARLTIGSLRMIDKAEFTSPPKK